MTSRRQQVVLAMLLLEANRMVTTDRLIDAVWDDQPPQTARAQIQICVSRLRQMLADFEIDCAISTVPPGYLLQVGESDLDLLVFERLAADSRNAARNGELAHAAEHVHSALELWCGEPLAGIDSALVRASAVRLTERRMRMVEERIVYQLDRGQEHELVDELMTLTAEFPLRERLWGQLMTVFCRLGRRSDALDAYRRARGALVGELGLEPGEELQQLQKAILQGEIEPQAAPSREPAEAEHRPPSALPPTLPPVPQLLPARLPDFVGREVTLGYLTDQLSSAAMSNGPLVLAVSGMAGVGKTALAVEAARTVAPHFPDGQLYARLNGTHPGGFTDAKEVLGFFLRTLGVPESAIPASEMERADVFRNLTAGRKLLIVLDDVESEEQVTCLLPGDNSCAALVTSRSRLAGLPSGRRVHLDVLSTAESESMLTEVIGAERANAEPAQLLNLAELCGGLPLALRAVASRLVARPHWTIGQLVERLRNSAHPLDELVYGCHAVRPSLDRSYGSLDAPARRLFCRLALLNSADFPAWVGLPLLDRGAGVAYDALDMLIDAQLVNVRHSEDQQPRYQLNDLVRTYAGECLERDEEMECRTAAVRRVLSCWLLLASEAHRREHGGNYLIVHGAPPRYALPEPLLLQILGNPLEWFRREKETLESAVEQANELGFEDICWDLAQTSLTAFIVHGDIDGCRAIQRAGLLAARRAEDPRGEAAMLCSLGSLALSRRSFDEAAAMLGAAEKRYQESGDRHGYALVLRNIASLDQAKGHLKEALATYEEALGHLEAVSDKAAQAHVLCAIGEIKLGLDDHAEARRAGEKALALTRAIGNRHLYAKVLNLLGETCLEQGDWRQTEKRVRQALNGAGPAGSPLSQIYTLSGIGAVRMHQGVPRSAEISLRLAQVIGLYTVGCFS
ncbi:AfsR/SARP family transcriptional regulator [Spirillospora sp. CA-294931]|uniref:AfsR/SARP family transcriptional regulator n=1 Tax=Spirillospora sp. CA-294931 TaxID=3240042 RepID=UPI003D8D5FF5